MIKSDSSLKARYASEKTQALTLAFLALLLFFIALPAISQGEKGKKDKNLPLFPDEYAELEEYSLGSDETNEALVKTLERARQKYLQAMILVEKKDTISASKYFERAINILNRLASYPGIEKNKDFAKLSESIIEDYENFAESIENLDEDSPFFVIREKLFQELETIEKEKKPTISTIEIPKDTSKSLVGEKPIVQAPKEIVIPLPENEKVKKNMAFLTKAGKKGGKRFFTKWLERSSKWFPMMRRIAAEEGTPEELIYLSMIESGMMPNAVSHASAVGLWQFIRSTGELYGLNAESSVWVDERRDPEKSTRAAMRHLRDLYGMFNKWHLALAAYNCGAGRVSRILKRYDADTADYWDISDRLPKETQHYVPIYVAAAKIALDPESYGFNTDSLNFHDKYDYDTYELTEPLSFNVIAKCSDTTVHAIRDLNPELIRSVTPLDQESYVIKLPKNKKRLFSARLSTLTPEEKEPWIEHQVSRGESLYSIAREYGVSRKELAVANDLSSPRARLRTGTKLLIPMNKEEFLAEKKKEEEKRGETSAKKEEIKKSETAGVHAVQKGETLFSIAENYGVNIAKLKGLNDISNDNIKVGQKLIIPGNEEQIAKNDEKETKYLKHRVRRGESLYGIARDYGVNISSIKSLNKLASDRLYIGQILVIETEVEKDEYAQKSGKTQTVSHKVQRGETLNSIAASYGVTEDNLKKWNPNKISGSTVYYGTNLKIIQSGTSKGSAKARDNDVKKSPKYYKVQSGDTFYSIARKFGISVNRLKRLNGGVDPDNLSIRQKIRIQ